MDPVDDELVRERDVLSSKLREVQKQVEQLAGRVPADSRRHKHLVRLLASTKEKLEALAADSPAEPNNPPAPTSRKGIRRPDALATRAVRRDEPPSTGASPSSSARAPSGSGVPPAPAPANNAPVSPDGGGDAQQALARLQERLAQAQRDNQLLWEACSAGGSAASPRLGHRTGWAPPSRSTLSVAQRAEVAEMVRRQEQLRRAAQQALEAERAALRRDREALRGSLERAEALRLADNQAAAAELGALQARLRTPDEPPPPPGGGSGEAAAAWAELAAWRAAAAAQLERAAVALAAGHAGRAVTAASGAPAAHLLGEARACADATDAAVESAQVRARPAPIRLRSSA